MSRLIDKLNQVAQGVPQPMGFRVAPPASQKPKMLLIASLTGTSVGNLADCVSGADGGLMSVSRSSGTKALHKASQAVPDIPWGGWLTDGTQAGIEQMMTAGCDFVVFAAADTSLAITQHDEVGKVLAVEASLGDGLLRAIDVLPVDAVFVTGEQGDDYFLTWHHLMLFQRFASVLTKPLLVAVPSGVTADELQVLWETGVDGVVVEAGRGRSKGRIGELRRVIDGLTFSLPRRRGRAEPLLPYVGRGQLTVTEEEEEEGEEE